MKTLERVVRLMTHVNIGAALGMTAWIAWSGWEVVSGAWPLPKRGPTTMPANQPHPRPPALLALVSAQLVAPAAPCAGECQHIGAAPAPTSL